MSGFLYRLGRSCARHPFRVIGLWLVAAFAVMSLQGSVGGEFNDEFSVPGVESQDAVDILEDRFPSQSSAGSRVVVHTADGRLDDAAHRGIVDRAVQDLAAGQDVAYAMDPFAPGSEAISADGQTGYIDVQYTVDELEAAHLDEADAAAATARDGGLDVEYNGSLAFVDAEEKGNEQLGILVAAIVLLIAFGSFVAMGLPIGTALFGILVGSAGVGIVAGFTDVPGAGRDGLHDGRPRRRHRLRAVHRHPAPAAAGRGR